MYISVKLLNGFKESLTYEVPTDWTTGPLEGTLIKVPLQNRYEYAYVEKSFPHLPKAFPYTVRQATAHDIIPLDEQYLPFLKKLSAYYALDNLALLRRLKQVLKEKERPTRDSAPETSHTPPTRVLTEEQQQIVDTIAPKISVGEYFPSLLHGVTGSGKTEIYKALIIHAWRSGKSTLFLFPEVSLAVQFAHLLKEALPQKIDLFSFHSASSVTEKRRVWGHMMNQKPAVILGVHVPIMLPVAHLGLIILDEEHDGGYQEKRHPKIHTKEAAFLRAQMSSIPIIAGSATPSVSSLYNVAHKGWHLFSLPKRFAGAFPAVQLVKLTKEKPRKQFFISTELEAAITEQLAKGEQTIIFLNRRGHSFFMQCASCGEVPHCPNCAVSLTPHNTGSLHCHYCTTNIQQPESCSACSATKFLKKGIGTQQVVTILAKLFPQARIARADLDTTLNKKQWSHTMREFEQGNLDILVGTQTITKGYHFPHVTLVGILWADLQLAMPMYNAAEVTLQQLIQVAGRAGRQSTHSRVIVQTLQDHPIFSYLSEDTYTTFYKDELAKRHQVQYPPCVRFAEIECKHADEATVTADAQWLKHALQEHATTHGRAVAILGPSKPPVAKIKNMHARRLYLKAEDIGSIISLYRSIATTARASSFYFTPNPTS